MAQDNFGQPTPAENPSPTPAAPAAGDPSLHAPAPIDPNAAPAPAAPAAPAVPDPTKAPAPKAWYDGLPQDMKDNPNIQKFKDVDGMAKSYLELSSLLGHEKVPIPKDENDLAAIAHLDKVRGVPDDVKGYELEAPTPPPGMEGMEFGMDRFKELAHKHKLTPTQAKGIMDDYTGMLAEIHKGSQDAYVDSVNIAKNELNKEWGLTYATKVKLAQDVMNKFAGSKEAFEHINAKLGADPVALKFLATVGSNFKEGSLGNLGEPATSFTKTPTEAKREYDGIMNDPNDIYWSGVRNNQVVSESVRKERITHVESLLRMQQPAKAS